MPSKNDILDLYFIDARHKLIDIAAFLDRVDRHDGEADFRFDALQQALQAVAAPKGQTTRAERILKIFSDHSESPIPSAPMQGAVGAVDLNSNNANQA